MEIKILGTGCPNCITLEKLVRNAVAELDVAADIVKVTDIMKIMTFGILHTPGLVINDKVVFSGRVPSMNEIRDILIKINKS